MRTPYTELISLTAYPWGRSLFGGEWTDVAAFCQENGLNGVELYTGYEDVPPTDIPPGLVKGVHLPFHSGWLEMLEEKKDAQNNDGNAKANSGRSPTRFEPPFFACSTLPDLYAALQLQIERAARLDAGYAVYHLGYYHTAEMLTQTYAKDDWYVLERAAEFLNELVSAFPNREPPVRLQFENLWYPGLTYTDPDACLRFMDLLEFSNYGFVLDTGHLMNRIAESDREDECIAAVRDCIETLPPEIRNRIDVVHLHWSSSHSLRQERIRRGIPNGFHAMQRHDQEAFAFQHAVLTDQHRPLSLPQAWTMLEMVDPSAVVHECIPKTLADLQAFLLTQRAALKQD